MFKIDKGVPMGPGKRRGRPRKYPFPDMEVGDSFFVPNLKNPRPLFASCAKHVGMKAAVRAEGDGYRVWRVE